MHIAVPFLLGLLLCGTCRCGGPRAIFVHLCNRQQAIHLQREARVPAGLAAAALVTSRAARSRLRRLVAAALQPKQPARQIITHCVQFPLPAYRIRGSERPFSRTAPGPCGHSSRSSWSSAWLRRSGYLHGHTHRQACWWPECYRWRTRLHGLAHAHRHKSRRFLLIAAQLFKRPLDRRPCGLGACDRAHRVSIERRAGAYVSGACISSSR